MQENIKCLTSAYESLRDSHSKAKEDLSLQAAKEALLKDTLKSTKNMIAKLNQQLKDCEERRVKLNKDLEWANFDRTDMYQEMFSLREQCDRYRALVRFYKDVAEGKQQIPPEENIKIEQDDDQQQQSQSTSGSTPSP